VKRPFSDHPDRLIEIEHLARAYGRVGRQHKSALRLHGEAVLGAPIIVRSHARTVAPANPAIARLRKAGRMIAKRHCITSATGIFAADDGAGDVGAKIDGANRDDLAAELPLVVGRDGRPRYHQVALLIGAPAGAF
jgi:hypothetical protein